MNISLTPELEAYIQQKVQTGMYNSSSEVVREALRLLAEKERSRDETAYWKWVDAQCEIAHEQVKRGEVISGEEFMRDWKLRRKERIVELESQKNAS